MITKLFPYADLLNKRTETDLIMWCTKYIDKEVLNSEEITLKRLFPHSRKKKKFYEQ